MKYRGLKRPDLVGMAIALLATSAASKNDPDRCRSIAPAMAQVSGAVGTLSDALGAANIDTVIQTLDVGSKEREALTKYRDDANKAIVALKALRKTARDTAYIMAVCGDG